MAERSNAGPPDASGQDLLVVLVLGRAVRLLRDRQRAEGRHPLLAARPAGVQRHALAPVREPALDQRGPLVAEEVRDQLLAAGGAVRVPGLCAAR